MKNEKFGFWSAWVAAGATIIFAAAMLVPDKNISDIISFVSSMFISYGYLGLACAFTATARPDRKASAYAGLLFAGLYAVFINMVYFTQISSVIHNIIPDEAVQMMTYTPVSWMFNMDLFGYGMLGFSTFFIGLSFESENRNGKWMKGLLMIHGVFALTCIIMPALNLFPSHETAAAADSVLESTDGLDPDILGVLVLEFWCVYFVPVMLLAANHFRRKSRS